MTEQPLPRRGRRLVLPHAIWLITKTLCRQTVKGWQRYHSLLRTNNVQGVVVEGNEVGR
jgi:hypothetical protein